MAAEERQRRALHMAIGGATYDQTARALSYNDRSAARQATLTALAKIAPADDANEWRNLQVARYERMIYVSLPDAIGEEDRPVDLHAQDRVRRNMEAQARLLGLSAPTQTTTPGNETGSLVRPELTLAEKRRIVEKLANASGPSDRNPAVSGVEQIVLRFGGVNGYVEEELWVSTAF
ncbi:MAG: hypothetical protein GY925_12835 [Actinomycetia bacterium]|nr:hypothetical protein [Actinomycetes bacterium]